jgi:predicted Zn-dependent protease
MNKLYLTASCATACLFLGFAGCKTDKSLDSPSTQDEPQKPLIAKGETPPDTAAATTPIALKEGTTPFVEKLIRRLSSGATSTAAALRQIVGGLAARLTTLPPTQPMARAPYSPDQLAQQLITTTEQISVHPIESTQLLLATADALGAKASPVWLTKKRSGATSIRHRDCAADITAEGFLGVYAVHRSATRNREQNAPITASTLSAFAEALIVLRHTEERRLKEATKTLQSLRTKLPDEPAIEFLAGHLDLLRGQSEEGLKRLDMAVKRAPDPLGWYLLGIAYLREDNNFKAYTALRKAAELDSTYAEPLAAIGAILMERWHNTPEDMRSPILKELDELEAALLKIGKDAFGLVELRIQRLAAQDNRAKAKELGVEALNMFPKRATLHLLMAELCEMDGETARMERHLERAAEVDPDDAEPLMRLAAIYAQRQEGEKLLTALKAATKRAPYDPDILDDLTTTLQQLGQIQEAQKSATELRDRFPELPLGYVRLAELSIASGNAIGAAALVDVALEKSPKDSDLYVLAYFAHTMAEHPEKAKAVVKRFIAFDPDARMKIAEPLLQAGQFEAAVQLLEQEIIDRPDRLEVLVSLAQLHALLKHPKDVARLRRILETQKDVTADTLQMFDEAIREVEAEAQANDTLNPSQAPPQ